jgi:PAS domain S-box-containing protein
MWLLRVEDANVYRVESVNSAYSNITGVEKEKVIGHLSEEVICLGNTDYIRSRYNEAVQTAQVVSFFTTAQFKEGPITAEIRMIPIANEEGKVVQLLGIAHNVTHQQKARKNLLKMNLQLRELTSHLHKVREEERTNMAREIHDELGQQLTGIKMDISWLGKKINTTDENIRNRINLLLQLADGTINTVRKIAAELRPGVLYDLGLAEAIDWHSKEFSKRTGIPVTFWTNVRDRKIPPDISIHIFRILQESLTNIARHANASKVHCDLLIHESRLLLIVADDGTGFDLRVASSKMTLGLLGMKERVAMINGKHEIVASPGSGTSISIEVPIPA